MELPTIPIDLIQAELVRILDSPPLRRAPSHQRLLRYLVTSRIAANAGALRENAIAIEVFRRDPSTYDPQADPIVRVTMRRLRERLQACYATTESATGVRIILPKGRYIPEFITETRPLAPLRGVLVAAMRNQTGDVAHDPLCDAFADRLRDHLVRAGVPEVRRTVATAVTPPSGTGRDGVWRLESTLARERERELRLTVRLVQVADDAVRWVETAAAAARDLASLAERMLDLTLMRTVDTLPLPTAVVGGRRSRVDASGIGAASPGGQVALEQVQLLLTQRDLHRTDDAVVIAKATVDMHPRDPDAWATLAAALYSRHSFQDRDGDGVLSAVRTSAEQALALAPEHPVALRTRAIIAGKHEYAAAIAEALFRRALRSLPNYTSARLNLAELLALQGKSAEALAELNLARLYDPLSRSALLARAIGLDLMREFAGAGEAWALCEAAGEASLWMRMGLGMHHALTGRLDLAAGMLECAAAEHPDSPVPLLGQARVLALQGDDAAARAVEAGCVARFPHASPAKRATIAACLGERDRLLALLTRARAASDLDLPLVAIDPALDAYAHDADIQRLLPFGCYVGLR